jgi:hypothetical protein
MGPEVREADQVEELGHARLDLRLRLAHDLERQRDVLFDRPPIEQDRRLEDDAEETLPACVDRVEAVDGDRAAARRFQRRHEAKQRRLPAAGRADQRHELADTDRERDMVERHRLAVPALEDLGDAVDGDRDGVLGARRDRLVVVAPLDRRGRVERGRRVDRLRWLAQRGHSASATRWDLESIAGSVGTSSSGVSSTLLSSDAEPLTSNW